MYPRPRIYSDKPPIITILRGHTIDPGPPPRHAIIPRRRLHRPRIRRPPAGLIGADPTSLAPGRDGGAGLPARQPGNVAQFGDGPAPLGGVAELDGGEEEAQRGFHQGGSERGVERVVHRYRLQAGADAADEDGPFGRSRGRDAGGGHGGWGHGRVHASCDDAAHVEEGPDAGDGIGPVI